MKELCDYIDAMPWNQFLAWWALGQFLMVVLGEVVGVRDGWTSDSV